MIGLLWCLVAILTGVIWLLCADQAALTRAHRAHVAQMDALRLRQACVEMQGNETREIAAAAQAVAAATCRYAFRPQGEKPS